MAFKKRNDDTHCKVYRYGALKPTGNFDLVKEQLKLAHDYYNGLVGLERARRQRWYDILGEDAAVAKARAAVIEADNAVVEALRALKDKRCETGTRRPDKALAKAVTLARNILRRAYKEQRRSTHKAKKTLKDKLDASNERSNTEMKKARAEAIKFGLYWGTEAVTKNALPNKGPPPKFRRWGRGGVIAAQKQIDNKDKYIYQIIDVKDWRSRKPGKILRLRIGSTGAGNLTPIWAEIPFLQHRPLPEDGMVKWVKVTARRIGTRMEWAVHFTVELPGRLGKVERRNRDAVRGRTIAFDLGWRRTDRGLRVAYGTDSRGKSYEILIPKWLTDGWGVMESLRSIRDRIFDDIRGKLVAWRKGRDDLPEWLVEGLKFSSHWKGQHRLISLLRFWQDNRFEKDADIIGTIEMWKVKDTHLYNWERYQERRCLHQRRELYRHWAKWLASEYSVVVFENLDITELKREPGIEEEEDGMVGLHMKGAPGDLRFTVEQAFLNERKKAIRVEHKGSTETCAKCGEVALSLNKGIEATCSECGVVIDRDCNASRILLSRARGGVVRRKPGALAMPEGEWYQRLMAEPRKVTEGKERKARLEKEQSRSVA